MGRIYGKGKTSIRGTDLSEIVDCTTGWAKKVSQKLMTITLSNLNGFSKFFQHSKENYRKLSTKPMLIKSYIN